MFCSKCGNEVSTNQEFCNRCGNRLQNSNFNNVNKKNANKKIIKKENIIQQLLQIMYIQEFQLKL